MFSTAPTFPFVAAIISGYKALSTREEVCDLLLFYFSFPFLDLNILESRSAQDDNTFLNIVTCRTDNASKTWLGCSLSF
jgi:hypothetical protein